MSRIFRAIVNGTRQPRILYIDDSVFIPIHFSKTAPVVPAAQRCEASEPRAIPWPA
ncbi:hypothetical protein [Pseudomonas fluorescens]|uniref:Uncharacterized protein n=1 Tax=Pseudomonas fluorescens TaxID=294 RepID=A0A5E7FPW3_PSEFL|nr:hypothetical protein [Pseudomonas fluorescens]VVO41366.1 hypothetical protein PS723_05877 [Pseudomonas fluorescens]